MINFLNPSDVIFSKSISSSSSQFISNPYNFTIDTNIDPFVVIELTSDNGYGQTFTVKKNYEIRSTKDLADPLRYPEPLLPFSPIIQLTRKIE